MESDRELVERACRGERPAFDELVRRHCAAVWRIALSFAPIPEDAHDLCQDTFVGAYEHLGELRDPARFLEWLSAIVRNRGRIWQRQRRKQPELLPLNGSYAEPSPEEDSLAMAAFSEARNRDETRRVVAESLAMLSPQHRRLLSLHYLHGYDYQETAALINLPVPAVRGRLHRARQALRKELRMVTTEGWELGVEELEALRIAAGFAWNSPEDPRPPIATICFAGDGRIVATDSYRLFLHQSAALVGLPDAVVDASLARELRDRYPSARRGRLELTDDEAILRLEDGEEVRAPRPEVTYPNFSPLLTEPHVVQVVARLGNWLEALGVLAVQRAGRPVTRREDLRIVMLFSPREQRVYLRQGLDLSEESQVSGETSVSFSASFPQGDDEFVMAVDAVYIEEALRALGVPLESDVNLLPTSQLGPFTLRTASRPERLVVTMPMTLPPALASEHTE